MLTNDPPRHFGPKPEDPWEALGGKTAPTPSALTPRPPLAWSTYPPTAGGLYLMRRFGSDDLYQIIVYHVGVSLYQVEFYVSNASKLEPMVGTAPGPHGRRAQWYGPIASPVERIPEPPSPYPEGTPEPKPERGPGIDLARGFMPTPPSTT